MTKKAEQLRAKVLATALSFPGTHVDHPWGETVVKVNKKVFVFLGMDDDPKGMSVKLDESNEQALSLAGSEPTGYGLGRAGWVSLSFLGGEVPSISVLRDWVEESYRIVAPKKLIAELDRTSRP